MSTISQQVSSPAYSDLGSPEAITPLFGNNTPPSLAAWQIQRTILKERWNAVLGTPSFTDFERTIEEIETFQQSTYRGTVLKQSTGPQTRQTLLLMAPTQVILSPRPGIVVPFYDPDRMAGFDLQTDQPLSEDPNTLVACYSLVCCHFLDGPDMFRHA
ncbi:MAG: hypothetical protein O7E52_06575 [Candidatus Poribacteria bacterium]|nr:hypothetical protein [Candidatus Poribacteria bacterium]